MKTLQHPTKKGVVYQIQKLLGKTSDFRMYSYTLPDGSFGILKIAITKKKNGLLEKEAFVLKTLRQESDDLESEYSAKHKGKVYLNYHFCFPHLVESFISARQQNRRVLILSFPEIAKELKDLRPISFITQRDKLLVDPRTSAWILGKLLKFLVFSQSIGVSIGNLGADNILINAKQHFVTVFDWSKANLEQGSLDPEMCQKEIVQVTKEVVKLLGGNVKTGEIPDHDQLENDEYQDLLKGLLQGKERDALKAHKRFYEIILALWPRGFHKFTTYSLITNK